MTTEQNSQWVKAVVGGFISGGSSAVTASITVSVIDPKDFGMANMQHLAMLAAATFVISGAISVLKYLKQHPLPGIDLAEESGK